MTETTATAPNAAVQTSVAGVKALFFDVFGTLVDWRTSIAREAKSILDDTNAERLALHAESADSTVDE